MKLPKKAAILCGGLGTRLRPLTDNLPKPMAPVNGKPFLEHLLSQLKSQGIQEFVLMIGYRGEQIKKYFGSGEHFGVSIQYSEGPVEWDTAKRIYEARTLLDDFFLLLYSDNFVPFSLQKLARFHESNKKPLSLILQPKKTGNMCVLSDGSIATYDKTRTADNLDYVEVGYMLVEKNEVFKHLREPLESFSEVLVRLVENNEIGGFVIKDPYHSISDIDRLHLTEQYLQPKKILLIDRDGVINEKAPRGEYITQWNDFRFIPETVTAMKQLAEAGFQFIIISNQAGIGRGVFSMNALSELHQQMSQYFQNQQIPVLDIFVCPHHWEDHCDCRKPQPGMFFQASRKWLLRLDHTFFIGDDLRDCQAAYNAGCASIFLGSEHELENLHPEERPQKVCRSLDTVTSFLINHDYFKNPLSN